MFVCLLVYVLPVDVCLFFVVQRWLHDGRLRRCAVLAAYTQGDMPQISETPLQPPLRQCVVCLQAAANGAGCCMVCTAFNSKWEKYDGLDVSRIIAFL